MKKHDFSQYSRDTLEQVLAIFLKKIGKPTVRVVHKTAPTFIARIEYPSSLEVSSVKQYADACLAYAFPEYHGDAPLLVENNYLKWGARVFVGDDMVDVSFQKFETLIKK